MKIKLLTIILIALSVISCSDSSGPSKGKLNLSVTDAPVDKADKVVIEFESVSIKPADGNALDFTFPAKQIDLLALSDGTSETILDTVTLDAGNYEWMRLYINEANSYIEIDGQQYPLTIPSNAQTGLKLNRGFTITQGSVSNFTIDFNLRKSVVLDNNGYKLKPVLRMIDNTLAGTLTGTVNISDQCTNASVYAGAVYVYTSDVLTADDVDGDENDPVASGMVDINDHTYTIGFLEAGDYKISYTCQADLDEAETDDSAIMTFSPLLPVTITANTVTTQDINP